MAQKYFGTYIKLNEELVKLWNDTISLYNRIRIRGKRITREDCSKFFEELSEIASKRRHLEDLLYKYRLQDKKVAKEYVDKYRFSRFLPFFVDENTYLETVISNIKLIIDEYIKPLLRRYCIKVVPPPPPPKAKSRLITIVGGYLLTNELYSGKNVELDITIEISVPVDFDEEEFIEKIKEWLEAWHVANGFYSIEYLDKNKKKFKHTDFNLKIGVKEDTPSNLEPIGLTYLKVNFSKKAWEYSLETFLEEQINNYLESLL